MDPLDRLGQGLLDAAVALEFGRALLPEGGADPDRLGERVQDRLEVRHPEGLEQRLVLVGEEPHPTRLVEERVVPEVRPDVDREAIPTHQSLPDLGVLDLLPRGQVPVVGLDRVRAHCHIKGTGLLIPLRVAPRPVPWVLPGPSRTTGTGTATA